MLGNGVSGGARLAPRRGKQSRSGRAAARGVRLFALALILAAAFLLFVDSRTRLFADFADGYRTEQAGAAAEAERIWRRAAWQQDDYFSQIRLGDLYSQSQSFPSPTYARSPGSAVDRVEAYVWYYLALRPHRSRAGSSRYSDTSDAVTTNANRNAQSVYNTLSFDERTEVRARLIYILASRGADGFITLGRLHRESGGFGYRGRYTGRYGNRRDDYGSGGMGCACHDSWWARQHWWQWLRSWFTDKPIEPVCEMKDRRDLDMREWLVPNDMCPLPASSYGSSSYGSSSYGSSSYGSSGYRSYGSGMASSTPGGTVSLSGRDSSSPADSSPTVSLAPQDLGTASNDSAGYSGGGYSGSGGLPSRSLYDSYDSGYDFGDYGPPSVFIPNNAEALMYFRIAANLMHPLANDYIAAVRSDIDASYSQADSAKIVAEADKRARFWAPLFEYYPGQTAGGVAHTDESVPSLEQRIALTQWQRIPLYAVDEALSFQGYLKRGRGGCHSLPACRAQAIRSLQKALGDEPTGFPTPLEIVRVIQMSAVDGDAVAQDRLGIMYAKGIGVPRNFLRAQRWFLKAANQRNRDALFNLYVLYKVGGDGIDQDQYKAQSYYDQAALAGNLQARSELVELLSPGNDERHGRPEGARR